MGCVIALIGLFSPRLALFVMFIFTDRLGDAFDSTLAPLFGFFLVPWTTMMYALVWGSHHTVEGFEWFLVAFAFLLDVGSYASGAMQRGSRD